jgi:inorganic pyrophosphatase
MLGRAVDVKFDRPLGSKHPRYDFVYEVNYGYIEGIIGADGEELDAYYLGADEPLEKASGICIAIAHRADNDDDKIIVALAGATFSDEEIMNKIRFQEQWFQTSIIRTP